MKRCPKVDRLIEERWLDTHQVSAYTGLSNTTIKRAVCARDTPTPRVPYSN
jgi:predicted DNA-binding transcriptional regulator AlpA